MADPSSPSDEYIDTQIPEFVDLPQHIQLLLKDSIGPADYLIDNAMERLGLVQKAQEARQSCTVAVLKGKDVGKRQLELSFNSQIFGVNADARTMEFDLPVGSPSILKGQTVRGSIKLQGIVTTFETTVKGSRLSSNGLENALVVEVPYKMCRLQRRDAYRAPVPFDVAVQLAMPMSVGGSAALLAARTPQEAAAAAHKVSNLSCGGLSILVAVHPRDVRVGMYWPKATLMLPADGGDAAYDVSLTLKHISSTTTKEQELYHRHQMHGLQSQTTAKLVKLSQHKGSAALPLGHEVLQLGLAFGHVSIDLDQHISKVVNELAIALMQRMKHSW